MNTETCPSDVKEYLIELAPSKDALMKKINPLIEKGWEPQGPLSIKYPTNAILPMYGQALVWRRESLPAKGGSGAGKSGCLGLFVLMALIPPAALVASHFA